MSSSASGRRGCGQREAQVGVPSSSASCWMPASHVVKLDWSSLKTRKPQSGFVAAVHVELAGVFVVELLDDPSRPAPCRCRPDRRKSLRFGRFRQLHENESTIPPILLVQFRTAWAVVHDREEIENDIIWLHWPWRCKHSTQLATDGFGVSKDTSAHRITCSDFAPLHSDWSRRHSYIPPSCAELPALRPRDKNCFRSEAHRCRRLPPPDSVVAYSNVPYVSVDTRQLVAGGGTPPASSCGLCTMNVFRS